MRTTPHRPVDVESLFPELAPHRAISTRLHPRSGNPKATDSSLGGPTLWPREEQWPTCTEPHGTATPMVPVLQLFAADVPEFDFPS